MSDQLPIAVIGGGPVGLAAAAHLAERGIPFRLYEAGASVGASVQNWSHVRLFSPWRHCIDPTAIWLLERSGWRSPPDDAFPTGGELVRDYLAPLSALPELTGSIETGARIVAVSRLGADKVSGRGRAEKPFVLTIADATGATRRELARAVIDASGTWRTPNPLGGDGLPADGEAAFAERIAYGIPDVLGRDRRSYARRRVAVVGAGHSAANALIDLVALADTDPATGPVWVTRSADLGRVYGGGEADGLAARGALGARLRRLVEGGRITLLSGLAVTAIRAAGDRLELVGQTADGEAAIGPFDRIVAATGQRPDLSTTRELRLELDPWLESARALGPLIDPNLHSCGSVPPHGHRELGHPEPGFYTVGIKSYGRAPTFLLLTGYEQARSVVAAIAGDIASADRVQLVLPETGVCSGPSEDAASCCGGPAPAAAEACCIADAVAKDAGKSGCGCRAAA